MDIYSPYYIQRECGGYSPCIEGNDAHGLLPFRGSVLPNCVGYATGRWNEVMGLNDCIYLGSTDAMYFMQYCATQNLQSGMTPQQYACMVWDESYVGQTRIEGHVAIVEQIISPTQVITSESHWNAVNPPLVETRTRNYGSGNWDYGATFLGFIYLPQSPVVPPYESRRKMPIWMMLRYGL